MFSGGSKGNTGKEVNPFQANTHHILKTSENKHQKIRSFLIFLGWDEMGT